MEQTIYIPLSFWYKRGTGPAMRALEELGVGRSCPPVNIKEVCDYLGKNLIESVSFGGQIYTPQSIKDVHIDDVD